MFISIRTAQAMTKGTLRPWELIEEEELEFSAISVLYQGVFRNRPTGKFYKLLYARGIEPFSSEYPFETEEIAGIKEIEILEVEKKEDLTWAAKEDKDAT